MKKLTKIIALTLLSNVCLAQFNANKTRYHIPQVKFKDGTILNNVKIRFVFDDSPSARGIILHSSDDRIYFHHYPYRPPTPVIRKRTLDDGSYRANNAVVGHKYTEHYKPPKYNDFNPVHIPQCCPSRIPFIHFDKPTLNALYKVFEPMGRAVKGDLYHHKAVKETIIKAAWHKPLAHEMNTRKESLLWQGKVEREMRLSWLKIYYGKWLPRRK